MCNYLYREKWRCSLWTLNNSIHSIFIIQVKSFFLKVNHLQGKNRIISRWYTKIIQYEVGVLCKCYKFPFFKILIDNHLWYHVHYFDLAWNCFGQACHAKNGHECMKFVRCTVLQFQIDLRNYSNMKES